MKIGYKLEKSDQCTQRERERERVVNKSREYAGSFVLINDWLVFKIVYINKVLIGSRKKTTNNKRFIELALGMGYSIVVVTMLH